MNHPLQGTVNLPGSKSESNRALMIAAYAGFPPAIDNLSEAHDTVLLQDLLTLTQEASPTAQPVTVDCEDAGTVARFMMTYLAGRPGTWLLTGTPRLLERPMTPLVDALRQLGADITPSPSGFSIKGTPIKGGTVSLDASLSSQFASSLLLAAPTWEQGLRLTLKGQPVSMPYLDMTLAMMNHFGVQAVRDSNTITVAHQSYHQRPFTVSADWSAASYWYEMMALCDEGELLLKGLRPNTLQGDAVAAEWFCPLGVSTSFDEQGARLTKIKPIQKDYIFDFSNTPDLFPSVFVTCVALHIDVVFKGIINLFFKESDRIDSLISELSKLYTFINIVSDDKVIIKKSSLSENIINDREIELKTYRDHRIAMALAGLTVRFDNLSFNNTEVVNKSYPTFWNDLKKFSRT